jgi:CRISPR-associated protein Csx17
MMRTDVPLTGCSSEPLISYLKALGVMRLVAEQEDSGAKGCWLNGRFVLRSALNREELVSFFLNRYRPTLIVVPWSGSDYFGVNITGNAGPYQKTPTSTKVVEAFLASQGDRLSEYRSAIRFALEVLKECDMKDKTQMKGDNKSRFIAALRSGCADIMVRWIDTCATLTSDKPLFNILVGSGGGNDGNTHFSDNFMQNLWDVLPDFDDQRGKEHSSSQESLQHALFGTPYCGLINNRTSALYDGGAVGGPNAGHGFSRDSLGNPWSIILCLEGTIMLAGSVTKRLGQRSGSASSFPFQVSLSPAASASTSPSESSGREMWLPVWDTFTAKNEIEELFSEGRATVGGKTASRAVDFARAATSLGIDRGIKGFQRYGLVRGRVGGENYYTSASLGHFDVRTLNEVDLLRQADPWLDKFRAAASTDQTPPRFGSALRRLDAAMFSFCRSGGKERFSEIMRAFGNAEREVASGERFRQDNRLQPLSGLSVEWLYAADDGSPEFEIASALAGIYDPEGKTDSIRANIEPVIGRYWKTGDFCHVWRQGSLPVNLLAILDRRVIDGEKLGCRNLPFASHRNASLTAIAAFVAGATDDRKIGELVWGLNLVERFGPPPRVHNSFNTGYTFETRASPAILPRAFALLKLLFFPNPFDRAGAQITLRPDLAVIELLRAGRVGATCVLAARRLKAGGLTPMTYGKSKMFFREDDWQTAGVDPVRLGAALLLPVSRHDRDEMIRMVIRPNNIIPVA